MPPVSYIITAGVLAALVVISFPMTLGFSVILWYWLFAAAGCVLAIAGAFRIASGLGAPFWIGAALASPGFVWAANKLFEMFSSGIHPAIWLSFSAAARLALLAAAAGALRLVEAMSPPHTAFRAGYALLAAAAVLMGVGLLSYGYGTIYPKPVLYVTRTIGDAATLLAYGAFIAASVMITMRRNVERWTSAVISLISAYLLYKAVKAIFVVEYPHEGVMFWLQPIVALVGGAAIWRMGSVLRAQGRSDRSPPNLTIANARPSATSAGP